MRYLVTVKGTAVVERVYAVEAATVEEASGSATELACRGFARTDVGVEVVEVVESPAYEPVVKEGYIQRIF